MLIIQPFGKEHIEAAEQIALANYREEREYGMKIYDDLLTYVSYVLKKEGFEYLVVDCESYNPTANRYWPKHFTEYTNSVVRKIELWCKEY